MKKILFQCAIPGRPYVKKNGAKVFRGRLIYTAQYRAWAETAKLYINQAMSLSEVMFPLKDRLQMEVCFCFENRSAEPDLSALYEGIQDVLQTMGVIANDRQICAHDGSRKFFGLMPKTIVKLYLLPENDVPVEETSFL